MKKAFYETISFICGLSASAVILLLVVGCAIVIIASIYGIYLAFSASIILGIVVLFIEPMPLIIGLVMLICHKDLALMIVQFLTK